MSIQYVSENAEIVSHVLGPFNINASNNVFQIQVDGGSVQTVFLTTGAAQTISDVVSDLVSILDVTISVVTVNGDDYMRITTTTSNGAASSIQMLTPVNNANTLLGLSSALITGLPRYSGQLKVAATKQNVADFVEASLGKCGWVTVSGSGTSNLLMQSGMSPDPQNLRYRVRLKDNGGACLSITIENVTGTKVGTSGINAGGLIVPNNRAYRIIANRHQFFLMVEGIGGQSDNRGCVYCGVPWIPSNLTGTIYEAIWLFGNSIDNTDTGTRGGFREGFGARNITFGAGNMCFITNGNLWELSQNAGVDGIGLPTLITLWQGARITKNAATWYRWHEDTALLCDPMIAWGLTANTDEGKIRGLLWESFISTAAYDPDLLIPVDGKTFFAVTYNNTGSDHQARGTLFTAAR